MVQLIFIILILFALFNLLKRIYKRGVQAEKEYQQYLKKRAHRIRKGDTWDEKYIVKYKKKLSSAGWVYIVKWNQLGRPYDYYYYIEYTVGNITKTLLEQNFYDFRPGWDRPIKKLVRAAYVADIKTVRSTMDRYLRGADKYHLAPGAYILDAIDLKILFNIIRVYSYASKKKNKDEFYLDRLRGER